MICIKKNILKNLEINNGYWSIYQNYWKTTILDKTKERAATLFKIISLSLKLKSSCNSWKFVIN